MEDDDEEELARSGPILKEPPLISLYPNPRFLNGSSNRLAGLDKRINYVTNGIINAYPLSFTIPLGFNQSDIIFTWQNLGQTNVSLSVAHLVLRAASDVMHNNA